LAITHNEMSLWKTLNFQKILQMQTMLHSHQKEKETYNLKIELETVTELSTTNAP